MDTSFLRPCQVELLKMCLFSCFIHKNVAYVNNLYAVSSFAKSAIHNLKTQYTKKWKYRHELLMLMSFQTCLTYFLL